MQNRKGLQFHSKSSTIGKKVCTRYVQAEMNSILLQKALLLILRSRPGINRAEKKFLSDSKGHQIDNKVFTRHMKNRKEIQFASKGITIDVEVSTRHVQSYASHKAISKQHQIHKDHEMKNREEKKTRRKDIFFHSSPFFSEKISSCPSQCSFTVVLKK